jgi:cytochrome P450
MSHILIVRQRYLGGALMEAGSDTTSSFLHSIILLFAAFPQAQEKAQEEMDRVVGSDRMPTPEDWKELPYVQAFIKEVRMSALTFVRILTPI